MSLLTNITSCRIDLARIGLTARARNKMGLSQLLLANPDHFTKGDLKDRQARRAEIKSAIRSTYLKGPARSHIKPNYEPDTSGQHYKSGVPIIAQFPQEILAKILSYLDPIWLFQAEAACSEVRTFLESRSANKLWYDAIPAALWLQPEYFQSLQQVAKAHANERMKYGFVETTDTAKLRVNSWKAPAADEFHYPAPSSPTGIYIRLPSLPSISLLWMEVDCSRDTRHPGPGQRDQYPLLQLEHQSIRKRNLALGGPFETCINYRRELLGHLFGRMRCYICFESFNAPDKLRTEQFGMRLCHTCLAPLILKHDEVLELSNLATLLNRAKHGVWVRERLRQDKIDGYWIPQVDDILRIATGLDYKTTVAKQRYFDHIYKATKQQRWPEQSRQLRLKIVDVAKKLWESPADLTAALGTESSSNVRRLRETFVPTSKLPHFLFPEHALHENADYLPYDVDSVWLDDPVNEIWHIHEMSVCMHDQVRISQMAHKMVRDLLSQKNRITTLCKAAHEYHVNRLQTFLQADTLLENLATQYPSPDQVPERLRVILSKLHLIKDQANHRIGLTPRGKAVAAAVLPKLLESACIVCPETQLLAPRGIDELLGHMRRAHPDTFWYRKFSILG